MQKPKVSSYQLFFFASILLAVFLFPQTSLAQNRLAPLSHTFDLQLDVAIQKSKRLHSSFQPLSESDLRRSGINGDSLIQLFSVEKRKDLPGWKRKLFHEHLFILDTQRVQLSLDPIYRFDYTHEVNGENNPFYTNTRGFFLQLQITDDLAVGSSFLENQAKVPGYIADRVEFTDVAFGQGRVKRIDTAFYDFAMSSAYLSYDAAEFINITIGHGKHFIGKGYRSHLLSDLAFNYPYLKLNTNWWEGRIQYQNLFALFQDLERVASNTASEELFERKFAAIHYLSIMPHPKLEVGFFESTIWPSLDSSGKQDLPFSSYVPLIFLNSFAGDEDDRLASNLGVNLVYRPRKELEFFSQLSTKDLDEGLSSFQFGIFLFPMERLRVGVEYNSISDSSFNYSHYNEGLSLPYAGTQEELIFSAQYLYKRWNALVRTNIFQGDIDQRFLMGELSLMVNPAVNSNLFLRATHRDIDEQLFISFGWRTSLQNLYFNY